LITAVVFLVSSGLAGAAAPDKNGCVDHPVFPTRMPGYSLVDCETKDFDAFNFETGKKEKTRVEGRRTKLTYRVEDRSKEPSTLAIVRNYENAIKSVQGTVLFVDTNRWVNGKIAKDGKEIWAQQRWFKS
jgi:OmpA-OmpF porin, OOP family